MASIKNEMCFFTKLHINYIIYAMNLEKYRLYGKLMWLKLFKNNLRNLYPLDIIWMKILYKVKPLYSQSIK